MNLKQKMTLSFGTYSTLLTLSDGLVLESPSHVNFTFGILGG